MNSIDRQPQLPNYLTTGQMARLNGISKKTLRLYQERGLLQPSYVDDSTGYRYYKLEQCAQLDMIQIFQTLGMSLQQIGDILREQNVSGLSHLLKHQMDILDEEIRRLKLARDAAAQMQESCEIVLNKPPCNKMTVEWMPHRRLLYFDVRHYDYSTFENIQQDGFYNWEMTLRLVKQQMNALHIPLSLFQRVACIGDRKALERGDFVITGAAIHIDSDFSIPGCTYYDLRAGLYLCCYCDGDQNGTLSFSRENELVHAMLDEICKNGYRIEGDYYGDVIADTPAFQYAARENFMRLQIPISIPHIQHKSEL